MGSHIYTVHLNNYLINWSSLALKVLTINHNGKATCIPRLTTVTAVGRHQGFICPLWQKVKYYINKSLTRDGKIFVTLVCCKSFSFPSTAFGDLWCHGICLVLFYQKGLIPVVVFLTLCQEHWVILSSWRYSGLLTVLLCHPMRRMPKDRLAGIFNISNREQRAALSRSITPSLSCLLSPEILFFF